jgi:hypothetical protein
MCKNFSKFQHLVLRFESHRYFIYLVLQPENNRALIAHCTDTPLPGKEAPWNQETWVHIQHLNEIGGCCIFEETKPSLLHFVSCFQRYSRNKVSITRRLRPLICFTTHVVIHINQSCLAPSPQAPT